MQEKITKELMMSSQNSLIVTNAEKKKLAINNINVVLFVWYLEEILISFWIFNFEKKKKMFYIFHNSRMQLNNEALHHWKFISSICVREASNYEKTIFWSWYLSSASIKRDFRTGNKINNWQSCLYHCPLNLMLKINVGLIYV